MTEFEVLYLWDQVFILFYSCYSSPWRIWFATASEMLYQKQSQNKTSKYVINPHLSKYSLHWYKDLVFIPRNITPVSLENRLPPSVLASTSLLCSSSFHPPIFSYFLQIEQARHQSAPQQGNPYVLNVNKETTKAQCPLLTHLFDRQTYDLRWLPSLPQRHGYWWAKPQITPLEMGTIR